MKPANSPLRRPATWGVPGLGAVALAATAAALADTPREGDRAELGRQIAALEQQRAELIAQSAPLADELTDRLPRTLSVGAMLERIEQAARSANVRAVSFGSDEQSAATSPAEATSGDGAPPTGPLPEVVRCEITVDGSFRALVHFIGLLETMPAVTRIANLSMSANSYGVTATVGVLGFAYSPQATPAAPEGR